MHDLNNQPQDDALAAERFQACEDATRLAWENAPANQPRVLDISSITTLKELIEISSDAIAAPSQGFIEALCDLGMSPDTVRPNFSVLPIEEMTKAEQAILTNVAENWNEPASDVLEGEAGVDHFKTEDTPPRIRGLSSPVGYFEEGSLENTRAAITNEVTIEPGVTGSLKNAGVLLDPPPGFSEGTYTSTDGQRKDIRDLNLLDVMNSVELQHPSNAGKSTPLTPELIVDGGESYVRKGSRATQMLLGTALAVAASTGMPMPEFKLPSRFRQERKHYDPKPEDATTRNERSAWNFGIEQNKQAKKDYKKAVPRSERVLPKAKK